MFHDITVYNRMVSYRYPVIAREGWTFIAIIVVLSVTLAFTLGVGYAIPLWVFLVFVLYVYRDPAREIPPLPLAIVGPVDGRVKQIETTQDPYAVREAIKITIDMTLLSVSSVRSPTEGKVVNQWHGMSLDNDLTSGSFAQWVQTDEEDDVVMAVKQHLSLLRPSCYLQSGERVGQGQRCGYIPLGATVEVYVPVNSRIEVKQGDHVTAGTDVIATLNHSIT